MSDTNRPLAVDFKQRNVNYGEATYSMKNKETEKDEPLQPSEFFSNNPIPKAPGTFVTTHKGTSPQRFSIDGISNPKLTENLFDRKKREATRSLLVDKIKTLKEKKGALFGTLSVMKNVYREAETEKISLDISTGIDEVETNITNAVSAEDFEKLEAQLNSLEVDLIDLKEDVDNTIAATLEENYRISELAPIQGRYLALESRAVLLSSKVSPDAGTKLLALFAPLKWLVGGKKARKPTPASDLIHELNKIEEELSKAESIVTKIEAGASDKNHETLNLFQKYADLAQKLGGLQKEAEVVSASANDDFKKKMTECEKAVEDAKKLFNTDPTAVNFESLKEKINEFETSIEEAKTGLKEDPIFIPWNLGLPSNRFEIIKIKGKGGETFEVLKIKKTDENGIDTDEVFDRGRSDYWLAQKKRFEDIFGTYTKFFGEDTPKKIKQYSSLIRVKNTIIEKFTRGNLLEAVASIQDFEEKLPQAIEDWKTKKAEEEANKKLEEEAKKSAEAEAASIEAANKKALKEEATRQEELKVTLEKNEVLLAEVLLAHSASQSTLTKEMLVRLKSKLEQKQRLVSEATNENVAERLDDLKYYQDEVIGVLTELKAPWVPINKRPLRPVAVEKDKSNQKIQLLNGEEMTVAQWEEKNRIEREQESALTEKSKKKGNAIEEMKAVYERMLGDPSDPQADERLRRFKEVYSRKDWSQDPVGLQAYKEIFFEIVQDQLVRRQAEMNKLILKQQENTFDEEKDGPQLKDLEQVISELKEDISSVNSLSYGAQMGKYRAAKSVDNETSHTFFRHVDRPSVSVERSPNKDGWDTKSQNEINKLTEGYVQPQTVQPARVLTNEEKETHNNLTPLGVEEIIKQNPTRFSDMSPVPMARSNEEVEEMEPSTTPEDSPHPKDENSHTPEYIARMKEAVGNVWEKLVKNRKLLATMSVPLVLVGANSFNNAMKFEEPKRGPTTLGQAMTKFWSDYSRGPEEQFFFEKIQGKRPEDFAKFIRETAPSVAIDVRTNTITSIPTLNVRQILKADSLDGVNNGPERVQLSKVVENLYQLGKHTDPNYKKVKLEPEMLPESLTLEQLYTATLSAIATANAKVAKDAKI